MNIRTIFYKYLSDTEIKWVKENDFTEEDIKLLKEEDEATVEFVQNNVGYFIEYNNLYSTWIEKGKNFDVSDVTDALSAFNRLISSTRKITPVILEEQEKLSCSFCDLDNLITLHQRKLEKLKNIKKSLLEKMFV